MHRGNILIYRLGSLGDTVMALPCFHRIRECFPDANITLLTNKPVMSKAPPLQAVLGDDYFFDQTLTYPVGIRNPILLAKLILSIRRLKIDTVINITALRSLAADRRDKLFFKTAGIQTFYGFDQSPQDFQLSIDPATGIYEWEAKRLARKIKKLGAFNILEQKYWDLRITAAEEEAMELALGESKSSTNLVSICTGTKLPVNDWGIANWKQLIRLMNEKFPHFEILVLGAPDDKMRADELLEVWKGKGKNLCGQTSPRVSAAIMKQSKIFVGHDSGPMHLAAGVGTPCVAVFSLINPPGKWFPRGNQNSILLPEGPRESYEPEFHSDVFAKSILTIKPQRVLRAIEETLVKFYRP